MQKMIQHVRHPLNRSRYVGTVAAVYNNGRVAVGFSQCHPSDQFNKKVGAHKAIGRAVSRTYGGFPLNKDGVRLVPSTIKDFPRWQPNPIIEAMKHLQAIGEKVWSDKVNKVNTCN